MFEAKGWMGVKTPNSRPFSSFAVSCCLLLATGFLLLTSVSAQNTGGAKGKVRNLKDEGIPNATISARQKGVDLKSVKTDAKGDFVLDGLEPGTYNLAFEARGYAAAVQYNVEIKKGKIRDLGDRLILMVDRGSRVIVKGSVFFKDGFIAAGAKVVVERLNGDGSVRKLGEVASNYEGEFTFSQPEGTAKLRLTAILKDGKAVKDIEVDSAMVYRTALNLNIDRPKPE
ncbi:MAG: carboxypeptidase-like regulatory domain-containing protein [Pyrinomonadaceae bacterium]